jgi:hypothetical protein
MELHQSAPPTFNNPYQTAPLPLQRSQSLHHPLASLPSSYEPLNPNHHNNAYLQQRFIHQPLTSAPPQQTTASFGNRQFHQEQLVPVPSSLPSQPQLVPYAVQQPRYSHPVHHVFPPQQSVPSQPLLEGQLPSSHNVLPSIIQQEYPSKPDAHLEGLRLVPEPPDLEAWREKLFGVDDMIVLSEEQ